MIKEITALELRKHFGEIMDEVRYHKEPYIVKRNGRPMLALVEIESFKTIWKQHKEEKFIEEYSDERIAEFLEEDKINDDLKSKIKSFLD